MLLFLNKHASAGTLPFEIQVTSLPMTEAASIFAMHLNNVDYEQYGNVVKYSLTPDSVDIR